MIRRLIEAMIAILILGASMWISDLFTDHYAIWLTGVIGAALANPFFSSLSK